MVLDKPTATLPAGQRSTSDALVTTWAGAEEIAELWDRVLIFQRTVIAHGVAPRRVTEAGLHLCTPEGRNLGGLGKPGTFCA